MNRIPDTPIYERRQVGWTMLVVLLGVVVVSVALSLVEDGTPPPPAVLGLLAAVMGPVLLIFTSLRVRVTHREIAWSFGPGWPRWRLALDDIERMERVRNPWWSGYGIRLLPTGWLYNVSGRDAVELHTRSGRVVRIGSGEPDDLLRVLRKAHEQRTRQVEPAHALPPRSR